MTVHRTTLACCVVFSAFLPGCSHSVPVPGYAEPEAVPPTPVVLEVENHNWADVVLYVLHDGIQTRFAQVAAAHNASDRKSTRLNSSHRCISYAVFCLKKKIEPTNQLQPLRCNPTALHR